MRSLKFPRLWLSVGLLLIGGVIVGSLIPGPPQIAHLSASDKVIHFVAYGLLMFWFSQLYAEARARVILALAFVALGIGLEYLQRMGGYRTFEYADMAADSAGVIFAFLLALTRLSRALFAVERLLLRLLR